MPYAYQTPIIVGSAPEVTRWKAMEAPSLVNALTAEYQARERRAAQERDYWNQERARADQAEQLGYNRSVAERAAAENAARWQSGQKFQREKMNEELKLNRELSDQASRDKAMNWFAADQERQAKTQAALSAENYANIFNNIGTLYKQPEDIPAAQFRMLTPEQQQNVAIMFKRSLEQDKVAKAQDEQIAQAVRSLGPNATQQQVNAVISQVKAGAWSPTDSAMSDLRKKLATTPELPVENPYWAAAKETALDLGGTLGNIGAIPAWRVLNAPSESTPSEAPLPLPKSKAALVAGKKYQTKLGIGTWNGSGFDLQ